MTTCNNCNNQIQNKFCSFCGQSIAMNGKINLKHFLIEFFHSIFHTGGGLFYTLKLLFFKPEIVLNGYLSGKRKVFFSPIKFFLITTIIYISSIHFVNEGINDYQTKTIEYYIKNYKYLMIFGPVLIAGFINWIIYKKKKLSYTENFIVSIYIFSGIYLISSFYMLLNYFANLKMIYIGIIIEIIFYSYAMSRFYNKNKVIGMFINTLLYLIIIFLFYLPIILTAKK
jgi:hypothetical protein